MSHSRALLVLGMHRSGTSALARLLNLWGAALPAGVLPPNHGNTAGYWEPAAIVALHDRLLGDAGSAWDDPMEFPPDWFATPGADRYVDELAAAVVSEFGAAPLIVIKDPRACRLVPIWERALGRLAIDPLAVIVVRHPLEVAASLHHRDGMPYPHGLLLWLQHVLSAEASTRGMPRVLVTFEQLLHDWASVRMRLEHDLAVTFPSAGSAVDAEVAAFLNPELRHERAPASPRGDWPDVSEWVQAVYRWCGDASRRPTWPDTSPLDSVRAELRRAEVAFAPLLREQGRRLEELDERQRALSQQRDELVRRQGEVVAEREAETRRWQAEALEWQSRASSLSEQAWRTEAALRQHIDNIEGSLAWRLRSAVVRQRERLRRLFGA